MTWDQQHLAGWLALVLQGEDGPLTMSSHVSYRLTDAGEVIISWRGQLSATLAADTLVRSTERAVVHSADAGSAQLVIDDLRVSLRALPPAREWDGGHQTLLGRGVVRESVIWTLAPESSGTGASVHVRIPPDHSSWSELSHLVVLDEESVAAGAHFDRRAWRRWNSVADVRIKINETWSHAQADQWLAHQVENQRPAPVTAVVLGEQCLIRLNAGYRIVVTARGSTQHYGWSMVPGAVHAAMAHPLCDQGPPSLIKLRSLGDAGPEFQYEIEAEPARPDIWPDRV
ncbi:hypothetical protein [Saccharopolyspora endophytica]|uniref:Uncharacterized protein n=1 Tax=Saccharopolyspora endophytica TaxID=543886 RepID=A0ABS5D9Y7_9PSEU|nr:hypothetical protein [Saccharopolyspora endophytica]MBQ0923096.1 hypothetical protein [Saccharopolyspora endophytica]